MRPVFRPGDIARGVNPPIRTALERDSGIGFSEYSAFVCTAATIVRVGSTPAVTEDEGKKKPTDLEYGGPEPCSLHRIMPEVLCWGVTYITKIQRQEMTRPPNAIISAPIPARDPAVRQ